MSSVSDNPRSLEAHKRWLGYLQPDGLVVSAAALVDRGHYYKEAQRQRQIEFIEHLRSRQAYDEENGTISVTDFQSLALGFLEWPAQEWVPAADLPDSCHLYLKESGETLSPIAALRLPKSQRESLAEGQPPWQLLLFQSGHPDGISMPPMKSSRTLGSVPRPAAASACCGRSESPPGCCCRLPGCGWCMRRRGKIRGI